MANKSSLIIAFIFGAGAGCLGCQQYFKKKYAQIAQEEIDSVKEVFSNMEKEIKNKDEQKEIIEENKYSTFSEEKVEEGVEMIEEVNKPYIISPDEFGETGNDTVSYIYYADDILTDETGEIVIDIEGTIGSQSLDGFGEYEDDSVFVRNESLGIDFEILKDLDNYNDQEASS